MNSRRTTRPRPHTTKPRKLPASLPSLFRPLLTSSEIVPYDYQHHL